MPPACKHGQTLPAPPAAPLPEAIEPAARARLVAAGREVLECNRVLEKVGLNVVGEVLRGQGDFVEMEHYPTDDVIDGDTHSQYYYHAHRSEDDEHGHFHTFLRAGALPPSPPTPQEAEPIAHLVGIAMDDWGHPIGLFATNRWVTGETFYPAAALGPILQRFAIDHAYPSWPTNRWITAMLRLFEPHIRVLLAHRDATIAAWRAEYPDVDAFEDRRLEITGYLPISVDEWLGQLQAV